MDMGHPHVDRVKLPEAVRRVVTNRYVDDGSLCRTQSNRSTRQRQSSVPLASFIRSEKRFTVLVVSVVDRTSQVAVKPRSVA